MSGGRPPGLGGGAGGFGDVGQAAVICQEMVRGIQRFGDIETQVEADAFNVEKHVN